VGYAIRMATNDRGGRRFQILAIVLTYWAVGLAYTPLLFSEDGEDPKTAVTATAPLPAASPVTSAAVSEPAQTQSPAAESGFEPGRLILAIGALLGFTFALPVLSVISSFPGGIISAAIIGFGMQQAWRMTGAPTMAISGPYRIAPQWPRSNAR
jgi:hypothetical protein